MANIIPRPPKRIRPIKSHEVLESRDAGQVLPPVVLDAQPQPDILTPNVLTPISPDVVTGQGQALIGYKNLAHEIPAATAANKQNNVMSPSTWDYWPITGSMSLNIFLQTAQPIDFIAIAGHNFGDMAVAPFMNIWTASTVAGALSYKGVFTVNGNEAKMIVLSAAVTAIRVQILFSFTGNPTNHGGRLGVVSIGKTLEMQRGIYGGHAPALLNDKTDFYSAPDSSGQVLGRTITRGQHDGNFSWKHITPSWYRSDFLPFVESAKKMPFFIMWRPDTYTDEVIYGMTTDDISATNMAGGVRLIEVGFKMMGHKDEL